ncbi:Ribonuclease H-like domain containing protein [Parasponia andersonii]|uniref:Ribonuclease H-like domain containing protein n=1 Tax=Parasponia andersonii TaxID=3476 RepID=A0A2P5D639_PARAD|nr:Ribonuclease H-like domain containing protein [Parasponia andersonii]
MGVQVSKERICWKDVFVWFGEFQRLNQTPSLSSPRQDRSNVSLWSAPSAGFLKLNIDATMKNGVNFIGIGAVIRVHDGVVKGALARCYYGVFSPFIAEYIAFREGLKFALSLNCQPRSPC